jgi:polyisoprenoid-binding protein YceI
VFLASHHEMKRTRSSAAILSIFCFCTLVLRAGAEHLVLQFDPDQTQIHWTVRENLRIIHGSFALTRGEVAVNLSTGSVQGELLVDTNTVQTGNRERDIHLRNEVLETGKYPQAFFHATQISGTLSEGVNDQVTVSGLFNIHGRDHPFTIPLHVQRTGSHAHITARFKVPYVAWGMKRPGNSLWKYSKEVEFEISSQATIEEISGDGV